MKSNKLFCMGYNGFKQFGNTNDAIKISEATAWQVTNTDFLCEPNSIQFCSSWSMNALAVLNNLYLTGYLNSSTGQFKKIEFPNSIKMISCNDNICLILLTNGKCYKYTTLCDDLSELNFLGVDLSDNDITSDDVIQYIACGNTLSVAVTNSNAVYNIPSKIHAFPKHVKVKKICCGAEHAILLTCNGDVYVWGSSSRGQLGLGQIDSEITPILVEGLAGIKIVDIAAGLWHSAAISAFGDLYMWGWNVNGQIGLPIYKEIDVKYESGRSESMRQKNTSVYASPTIIDIPSDDFSIERVNCGARHTLVETKCGKIFGCGFNRYGQLGETESENSDDNVDKLVELNVNLSNSKIMCGSWCTIFVVTSL